MQISRQSFICGLLFSSVPSLTIDSNQFIDFIPDFIDFLDAESTQPNALTFAEKFLGRIEATIFVRMFFSQGQIPVRLSKDKAIIPVIASKHAYIISNFKRIRADFDSTYAPSYKQPAQLTLVPSLGQFYGLSTFRGETRRLAIGVDTLAADELASPDAVIFHEFFHEYHRERAPWILNNHPFARLWAECLAISSTIRSFRTDSVAINVPGMTSECLKASHLRLTSHADLNQLTNLRINSSGKSAPLSFDYGVALEISKKLLPVDLRMLSLADESAATNIVVGILKTLPYVSMMGEAG